MSALDILIALLKLFEGCRLTAYQDVAGIWTIGYGETLGVSEGMVWAQDEADQHLAIRAASFLEGVVHSCPQLANEPPYRQAACASLAYNIGLGAFANSTVCRQTQNELYSNAAQAFLMWDKADGNVVEGLLARRQKESSVYLNGYP